MGEDQRKQWDGLRAVFVRMQGAAFCAKVTAYMTYLHWYADTFMERTGQSQDTYRRITRSELLAPKKIMVMAICVGLGLDYRMAVDLLLSAGYALSLTNKTDIAYDYVLLKHAGEGLEVCNRELIARGVKPLIVLERKPTRIGKVKIA